MILSNIQMQAAMDSGRLIIRPRPLPDRPSSGTKSPYDTHSVNLTLSHELSVPSPGPYVFDLSAGGNLSSFLTKNSEKETTSGPGYALQPGKFILGRTIEFVGLPLEHEENLQSQSCLSARIEGRSSVARCGVLVHFTAPTVHPGFEGTLTLEIINLGPAAFMLRQNMPIAQLIIEQVSGIPFENPSQFKGQVTPEGGH